MSEVRISNACPEILNRLEQLQGVNKEYKPFARLDSCGATGKGPYGVFQVARMAVSILLLLPIIKLILVIACFSAMLMGCSLVDIFVSGETRLTLKRAVAAVCARSTLFCLGFFKIRRTRVSDAEGRLTEPYQRLDVGEPYPVIVTNHVSGWDIVVMAAECCPSFVAKSGVANAPLVGPIAKSIGTIFISRDDKDAKNVQPVKGNATLVRERALDPAASPLLVFPEGTTSNGAFLLPFHTSAFLAQKPVQPLVLKYRAAADFSPAFETIGALTSLGLLLCQWVNHLEIVYLPLYIPSKEEMADPKLYASNVREHMAAYGELQLSDLSLKDKRRYHSILKGEKVEGKDT
ncbi:Lysophosphatidylcholine acyltransferase 2 [Cymbomonas tetramitiformis]|uniref:Lysophosphatidylcholine acyltransferase 2 n=1 Tax=Cymbomonas tetramitiformis TaxID=36881 RepID=A0AAE0BHX3_9CHLO|nr:Lysophosphatidylcholine acyltransferase 2 [Cymbomonas tetramitiformis]